MSVLRQGPNGLVASRPAPNPERTDSPTLAYRVPGPGGNSHIRRGAPSPITAGLLTGATEVPVAGWIFKKALINSGAINQEGLEELARHADSDPFGKGARFAASFIPEMAVGGGLMAAGRKLALSKMGQMAPAAARVLGPGSRFTPQLERMAAWSMDTGGVGPVGLPMFARAGEMAAGSASIGTLYGADALLEGDSVNEAAYKGFLAAGLTLGGEAALMGVARGLGVRGPVNARAMSERHHKLTKETKDESLTRLQASLTQAETELNKAGVRSSAERMAMLEGRVTRREADLVAGQAYWDLTDYTTTFLRGTPKEHATILDEIGIRLWKTPERAGQELGVSGGKAMHLAQDYLQKDAIAANLDHRELSKIGSDLAAAFGKRAGKGNEHMLPMIQGYQAGGVRGAERAAQLVGPVHDPAALRRGLTRIHSYISEHNRSAGGLGLREAADEPGKFFFPLLVQSEIPRNTILGKTLGFPRSPEAVTKQFEDALVKLGRDRATAGSLATDLTVRAAHKAPDLLNKELGLTLPEALAAGIPLISDPLVALQVWGQAVNRRVAYTTNFGSMKQANGKYVGTVIHDVIRPAVAAEGGSTHLFDLMMESVAGGSYSGMLTAAAAEAITNGQVAARMGTSVFANMTQPINSIANAGIAPFLRGVGYTKTGKRFRMTTDPDMSTAMEGLALNDSMIQSWREAALDPQFRTPLGKFADWVLHRTGFTKAERFNRMSAAGTGMHDVSKTLVQGISGQLRGRTLDSARRRISGYGLDLDDMIKRGRAMDSDPTVAAQKMLSAGDFDLLKRAGMGATRRTQFLPDATRRPLAWSTPAGRIMTQFKSFALSQTRFLRDQVLGEAAAGNFRPLSYYLAMAPISGEFVVDMRNLVTGRELKRPDSPLAHALENLMAVGGLGLGGELFRAATFGGGDILRESVGGPTISDLTDAIGFVLSGEPEKLAQRVGRMGTVRAGLTAGKATALLVGAGVMAVGDSPDMAAHLQALRHYGTQSTDELEAPTLDELRQQSGGGY